MRCSTLPFSGPSVRRSSNSTTRPMHEHGRWDVGSLCNFIGEFSMNIKRATLLIMLLLGPFFVPSSANAADTPNPVFKGKKVLLVAATASETAPVDANIKKHFESLGMIVNMVSDVNPPPAEGYDLVFLASDIK